MNGIPTPLQALVALLAECEKSLDFRPSFRGAMSDAYTAILNPLPAGAALMQSITLGESLETPDTELTFTELFGEPERQS